MFLVPKNQKFRQLSDGGFRILIRQLFFVIFINFDILSRSAGWAWEISQAEVSFDPAPRWWYPVASKFVKWLWTGQVDLSPCRNRKKRLFWIMDFRNKFVISEPMIAALLLTLSMTIVKNILLRIPEALWKTKKFIRGRIKEKRCFYGGCGTDRMVTGFSTSK